MVARKQIVEKSASSSAIHCDIFRTDSEMSLMKNMNKYIAIQTNGKSKLHIVNR